jgi:DNA polymerase-3 subunit epsilon
MILFFDTETTGLPDWRAPSKADHQPHIVQLAAILMEPDGTEAAAVDLIVRPDGWDIPDNLADLHGISTERAMRCGVREELVVVLWRDIVDRADLVVAHNVKFDARIMRIASARFGRPKELEKPTYCTMEAAAPIVDLPPTERMIAAGFDKPKPPKLEECVRHFFGREMTGAHNALVDVRECAAVYQHLKSLEGATA